MCMMSTLRYSYYEWSEKWKVSVRICMKEWVVGIDILYHGHSFLTTISQVEVSLYSC